LIHFYKRYSDIFPGKMALFNFVTGLLTGIYAGVYLSQNYNVPAVPNPASIVDKAKKFLEDNKKDE